MRIPSGKTDQNIYFVAVDATDLKTREPGLTSFTVYRSRNGAAEVAYTTPTVTEIDATNMPGVYALLIDEDTTIASTSDSEEYCVHITQASMAPVTRTIELYRRTATSGQTIGVTSSAVNNVAVVDSLASGSITAAVIETGAIDADAIAASAVTEIQAGLATQASVDVIDDFLDTEVAAILAAVDTEVAAIKAKTDSLTFTTANRVDSQVFGMEAGTVTAAAVATNAIDADAIAADAVDEIWDEVMEGTTTARQSLRLANSANGAKLSGAATTSIAVRDLADTKNRIAATVDADGNRSAVTLDLT